MTKTKISGLNKSSVRRELKTVAKLAMIIVNNDIDNNDFCLEYNNVLKQMSKKQINIHNPKIDIFCRFSEETKSFAGVIASTRSKINVINICTQHRNI